MYQCNYSVAWSVVNVVFLFRFDAFLAYEARHVCFLVGISYMPISCRINPKYFPTNKSIHNPISRSASTHRAWQHNHCKLKLGTMRIWCSPLSHSAIKASVCAKEGCNPAFMLHLWAHHFTSWTFTQCNSYITLPINHTGEALPEAH